MIGKRVKGEMIGEGIKITIIFLGSYERDCEEEGRGGDGCEGSVTAPPPTGTVVYLAVAGLKGFK